MNFLCSKCLISCPLQVRCEALVSQLQDAQGKLATEREETKNAKRHAEFLNEELLQTREQLEKMSLSCDQAERSSGKLEVNSKSMCRNLDLG